MAAWSPLDGVKEKTTDIFNSASNIASNAYQGAPQLFGLGTGLIVALGIIAWGPKILGATPLANMPGGTMGIRLLMIAVGLAGGTMAGAAVGNPGDPMGGVNKVTDQIADFLGLPESTDAPADPDAGAKENARDDFNKVRTGQKLDTSNVTLERPASQDTAAIYKYNGSFSPS